MTNPRQHGHALIALALMAMLAAAPPDPSEPAPAPPAFVAIQPFDEQLVAMPTDLLDADNDATNSAAPPDPSSGLFAA